MASIASSLAGAGGILGNGITYAGTGVLAALAQVVATSAGVAINALESAIGPWRPPQWAKPPVTAILVPGTPGNTNSTFTGSSQSNGAIATPNAGGIPTIQVAVAGEHSYAGTPSQLLIFDGVLKLEHNQGATPTEFPVQSGANLSDHIFIKPARLTMQIFMSDVMQSYTPGQFLTSNTRSVSAYQVLKALLTDRTTVTCMTKLDTYANMVLIDILTPDSFETNSSLKATCVFQQIFTAQISSTNVSSRTGTTDLTQLGNVATIPVPDVVDNNYFVPPPLPAQSIVPYSGTYSSLPVIDDPTFGS